MEVVFLCQVAIPELPIFFSRPGFPYSIDGKIASPPAKEKTVRAVTVRRLIDVLLTSLIRQPQGAGLGLHDM